MRTHTITNAGAISRRRENNPAHLNIMICGIINGKEGIRALRYYVKQITRRGKIDLVVANVTNLLPGGKMPRLSTDTPMVLTSGIPVSFQSSLLGTQASDIIFPINQTEIPDKGFRIVTVPGRGVKVGVISMGEKYLNPFEYRREVFSPEMENCELAAYLKQALAEIKKETPIVIIDFYSEGFITRRELLHFLEGEITFLGGSKMELPVESLQIHGGTAYVGDVGKIGKAPENENIMELDAVLLSIDPVSGKVVSGRTAHNNYRLGSRKQLIKAVKSPVHSVNVSKSAVKLLAIGDVSEDAVPWVEQYLRRVRRNYHGIIVNGEHAWERLRDIPEIDVITNGNHSYEGMERVCEAYDNQDPRVIFPQNQDPNHPANQALKLFWEERPALKENLPPFFKLCATNSPAFGVVNMGDPSVGGFTGLFDAAGNLNEPVQQAIGWLRSQTPLIFIDFHFGSNTERRKLSFTLDGKVTAVYGTHQHQQYQRSHLLPKGTGMFGDIGFAGHFPLFLDRINPFSFILSFRRSYWKMIEECPEAIPVHIRAAMEKYRKHKINAARDPVIIQGIEIVADANNGKTLVINPINQEVRLASQTRSFHSCGFNGLTELKIDKGANVAQALSDFSDTINRRQKQIVAAIRVNQIPYPEALNALGQLAERMVEEVFEFALSQLAAKGLDVFKELNHAESTFVRSFRRNLGQWLEDIGRTNLVRFWEREWIMENTTLLADGSLAANYLTVVSDLDLIFIARKDAPPSGRTAIKVLYLVLSSMLESIPAWDARRIKFCFETKFPPPDTLRLSFARVILGNTNGFTKEDEFVKYYNLEWYLIHNIFLCHLRNISATSQEEHINGQDTLKSMVRGLVIASFVFGIHSSNIGRIVAIMVRENILSQAEADFWLSSFYFLNRARNLLGFKRKEQGYPHGDWDKLDQGGIDYLDQFFPNFAQQFRETKEKLSPLLNRIEATCLDAYFGENTAQKLNAFVAIVEKAPAIALRAHFVTTEREFKPFRGIVALYLFLNPNTPDNILLDACALLKDNFESRIRNMICDRLNEKFIAGKDYDDNNFRRARQIICQLRTLPYAFDDELKRKIEAVKRIVLPKRRA